MHPLSALSPLDGRYADQTRELTMYFSEMALMKYRLLVEVEYFIALGKTKAVKEFPPLPASEQVALRKLYHDFCLEDAQRVKAIEATTRHDVKAIEYFIQEKIKDTPSGQYASFVHFALTSEDINNLAYSLMWRSALQDVYLLRLQELIKSLQKLARTHRRDAMLALTHGQSATPTTVGKELAVFVDRLERQYQQLKSHRLQGKLSGATGTWGAHAVSYPRVDWKKFSATFVRALGLDPNLVTTQIEPHDSLAESYHIVARTNTILLDLSRDLWLYVMRGVFGQKATEGEVGSSAMPHKVNPIYFENAEGNIGLANANFEHLSAKLPVSRLQRDLSDSTVLRNQGVALAHSLIAIKSLLAGLQRLWLNKHVLHSELDGHWEVLAEAIQTVLRKHGRADAYEELKKMTRGHHMDKETLQEFIGSLDIPKKDKDQLLELTPHSYIGLAADIT